MILLIGCFLKTMEVHLSYYATVWNMIVFSRQQLKYVMITVMYFTHDLQSVVHHSLGEDYNSTRD